jgi:hypothetical protein
MNVEYLGVKIEVPDYLIETYIKQFDGLPGSKNREDVLNLRCTANEVIDYIAEDPEVLYQYEYRNDFINALAVQKALATHGILHDS